MTKTTDKIYYDLIVLHRFIFVLDISVCTHNGHYTDDYGSVLYYQLTFIYIYIYTHKN